MGYSGTHGRVRRAEKSWLRCRKAPAPRYTSCTPLATPLGWGRRAGSVKTRECTMSEGGQVLARGDQGWREQLPDTTTVLLSAEWNVDGESYPPPVSRVPRQWFGWVVPALVATADLLALAVGMGRTQRDREPRHSGQERGQEHSLGSSSGCRSSSPRSFSLTARQPTRS
jgi:hypothetical protein